MMQERCWLDAGENFPPPGRVSLSFDDAHKLLVEHEAFENSTTRQDIWAGLERYLLMFYLLEDRHPEVLGDRSLLLALWIGGSYVSSKVNPKNLDLTVILDATAREDLKGKPGSAWLRDAFSRDRMLAQYHVSPLQLLYRPVISLFRSHQLSEHDQTYLRERGAWDDWWQRCRLPGLTDPAPSIETVAAKRGYLEVTL